MFLIRIVSLAGLILFSIPAHSEDAPYIAVGKAATRKTVIAYAPVVIKQNGNESTAQAIQKTVTDDLTYMDLFKFLPSTAFLEKPGAGLTLDKFKITDWSGIGAEILIKSSVSNDGSSVTYETYVYETKGKTLLAKRYIGTRSDLKTIAHTFANDIVEKLTGLPGVFMTKIAMSCDRTGKKEIYTMNFDGSEVRQLTNHRSISMAPAWSPDGTRIAYSVYNRHAGNIKNIDLYEFNLRANTVRMLSNRKGMNSGASYSPDGSKIAMTMSFLGNPEIFELDPSKGSVTRLTNSFGFDVDPVYSPDGAHLAFVSSRGGQPMIYKMNIATQAVQRLTFAGRYNATPSWSPQNNKIAFAGWLDSRFDIFIMNPDGTHIERLTKNQGGNEDPHFSPDGNFITFSSDRAGKKNIYVMNMDGSYVKRLTYGLGNCEAPKWSKNLK